MLVTTSTSWSGDREEIKVNVTNLPPMAVVRQGSTSIVLTPAEVVVLTALLFQARADIQAIEGEGKQA